MERRLWCPRREGAHFAERRKRGERAAHWVLEKSSAPERTREKARISARDCTRKLCPKTTDGEKGESFNTTGFYEQ